MKRSNRIRVVLALVVSGVAAFGLGAVVAQPAVRAATDATSPMGGMLNVPAQRLAPRPTPTPHGPPPVQPDWVLPGGKVDMERLPACFHSLDHNGDRIKGADGKEICIPSDEIFAPPPLPSAKQND